MANHPSPLWAIPAELKKPALIFISAVLIFFFGLMLHPLVDPDVFIHLRDGRHWVESGLQVGNDPFAYTIAAEPIEKVEWLFRIGIYSLYRLGGFNLLIISKAVVMTLAFFLFGVLLYRRWPNLGVVSSALLLSIVAIWVRVMPERPQIFTFLFLPLCLLVLEDFRRIAFPTWNTALKKLIWIPLLVIPWANLHPGFIIVLIFPAAYILEELWQLAARWTAEGGRRLGIWLLLLLSCWLAGSLTPLGFDIYTFVSKTMSNPLFLRIIVEWMPSDFSHKPVFFMLLGLAWLAQLLCIRKTRIADLLLLLIFSYLAIQSRRNIILFLIAVLPGVCSHLRCLWQTWGWTWTPSLKLRRRMLLAASGLMGLGLIALTSVGYACRLGEFPDYYPEAAMQWLEEHQLQGHLFTPLHWGGYIGWITHGQRQVFMDGRLPAYAGKIFDDYYAIIYGTPQCLEALDQNRIEILMVSPKNYYMLFEKVVTSGNWALVYWDHMVMIYVRRQGVNQALANEYAYLHLDPSATPYYDTKHPEASLAEIRRAQLAAPDSFLPLFFEGDLLMNLGQDAAAEPMLQKAEMLEPKHAFTLQDLGVLALKANRLDQAEQYLLRALRYFDQPSWQAQPCYFLALTLQRQPQRRAAALHWAKRALQLQPNWPECQKLIQELSTQP